MKVAECNTIIPQNINSLISKGGYKKCAVAERAGLNQRIFSDMLNGRRVIKPIDILNISKALNVTPNEIFGINSGQKSA